MAGRAAGRLGSLLSDIGEAPGEGAEGDDRQHSEQNLYVRGILPETEPGVAGASIRNGSASLNHPGQGLYNNGERNNGIDRNSPDIGRNEFSEMGEEIKVPLNISIVWKKDGSRARLVYDARFVLDDNHGGFFTPQPGSTSQTKSTRPNEHCAGEARDTVESQDTHSGAAAKQNRRDGNDEEGSSPPSV